MKCDVLLELGVEKIRKDFGDFTSTIFQLISLEGNCTIQELNLLVPTASYCAIRSTIFLLYQHSLISVKVFQLKGVFSENFTENTKFFTNIYQAVYRIRFPRFLAFSEYEFGITGRILVGEILEKGQITCKNILNLSKKKGNCSSGEIADTLIQLGRDNLIHGSFFFFENQKKKNGSTKPIGENNSIPWKISVSQFNHSLKVNILINLIQESSFSEFRPFLRSSFSRIFGFKNKKLDFQWFSMDTLTDFFLDFAEEKTFNTENQLVQIVENQLDKKKFLDIKFYFYKIEYSRLFLNFRQTSIENLIKIKFGIKFLKIFKILVNLGSVREEILIDECLMNGPETRKILFEMYRMGLVFLEENSFRKKSSTQTSRYFWKINFQGIMTNLFAELIKSIFYIFLKMEKLSLSMLEISKTKIFFGKNYKFSFSPLHILYLYDILVLGLTRLDEIFLFFF